ncbi:MAG: dienelactone hydrolase family protein [Chloroflexi bacterium]|nr:dienelactone hydrolase family protein [Chloroflexota bacterium]
MTGIIKGRDKSAVEVKAGKVTLQGNLEIPEKAVGIVAFAHGSGSSRLSPRNRFVAGALQKAGLATLLFDLLTAEEEAEDVFTARLRFDIDLLTKRLIGGTDWLLENPKTRDFNIGYFGSSTGAAAALMAAAEKPDVIRAIVSRGGRPDLAMASLPRVKAPTLLIVGGRDYPVIEMNQEALNNLKAEKRLVIVPGATHLFEEPGALEQVATYAADWFVKHLGKSQV